MRHLPTDLTLNLYLPSSNPGAMHQTRKVTCWVSERHYKDNLVLLSLKVREWQGAGKRHGRRERELRWLRREALTFIIKVFDDFSVRGSLDNGGNSFL